MKTIKATQTMKAMKTKKAMKTMKKTTIKKARSGSVGKSSWRLAVSKADKASKESYERGVRDGIELEHKRWLDVIMAKFADHNASAQLQAQLQHQHA
jgi:hypothetical protein